MKIIIFIMVLIMIIGCSTIPNEYKVEPNESEIIYIESGAVWGVAMSIIIAYASYYLDKKSEWY